MLAAPHPSFLSRSKFNPTSLTNYSTSLQKMTQKQTQHFPSRYPFFRDFISLSVHLFFSRYHFSWEKQSDKMLSSSHDLLTVSRNRSLSAPSLLQFWQAQTRDTRSTKRVTKINKKGNKPNPTQALYSNPLLIMWVRFTSINWKMNKSKMESRFTSR